MFRYFYLMFRYEDALLNLHNFYLYFFRFAVKLWIRSIEITEYGGEDG